MGAGGYAPQHLSLPPSQVGTPCSGSCEVSQSSPVGLSPLAHRGNELISTPILASFPSLSHRSTPDGVSFQGSLSRQTPCTWSLSQALLLGKQLVSGVVLRLDPWDEILKLGYSLATWQQGPHCWGSHGGNNPSCPAASHLLKIPSGVDQMRYRKKELGWFI